MRQTQYRISQRLSEHRILESAVTAGANVIISGDKYLPKLGLYESVVIPTLSKFLADTE